MYLYHMYSVLRRATLGAMESFQRMELIALLKTGC